MENKPLLEVDEAVRLWNVICRLDESMVLTYNYSSRIASKFLEYVLLAAGLGNKLETLSTIIGDESISEMSKFDFGGCAYFNHFSENRAYIYEGLGFFTTSLLGPDFLCMKMRAEEQNIYTAAEETIELYERDTSLIRADYENNFVSVFEHNGWFELDYDYVQEWADRFLECESLVYEFCKAVILLKKEGIAVIENEKTMKDLFKLWKGTVCFKDMNSSKDFFSSHLDAIVCMLLGGYTYEFDARCERVEEYASDALPSIEVHIVRGCGNVWKEIKSKDKSSLTNLESILVQAAESIIETPFFTYDGFVDELSDIVVDGDDLMFLRLLPETTEVGYEIEAGSSIRTILAPLVFDAISCNLCEEQVQ